LDEKPRDNRNGCAATYSILKAYSPNDQTIADFKKSEATIIGRFLKKTSGLLSAQSAIAINENAKSWHFIFAPSQSQALQMFKDTLSAERDGLQEVINHTKSTATAGDVVTLALDTENTSELSSICIEVNKLIKDQALRNEHAVYVSPVVTKLWPKTGGILNHELGHLLDYALKSEGISDHTRKTKDTIETCLKSRHAEASSYSVEDWADFAGQIANDKDAEPFECLFLRDWVGDGEFNKRSFSLENSDPTDKHSGDMYRALAKFSMMNGDIPKSCRSALQQKGEQAKFKDCRATSAAVSK